LFLDSSYAFSLATFNAPEITLAASTAGTGSKLNNPSRVFDTLAIERAVELAWAVELAIPVVLTYLTPVAASGYGRAFFSLIGIFYVPSAGRSVPELMTPFFHSFSSVIFLAMPSLNVSYLALTSAFSVSFLTQASSAAASILALRISYQEGALVLPPTIVGAVALATSVSFLALA